MQIQQNISLQPYTSFGLGGHAQNFVEVHDTDELFSALEQTAIAPLWLLGYGSNTLISDNGLNGLVMCLRGGTISIEEDHVIADAGVWWDDVVQSAIKHELWGTELMSMIPGSVGAAAFINITAYGQSIGPLIEWVDVWDPAISSVRSISRQELEWGYKSSIFQQPENQQLVILRASLKLAREPTGDLSYQKALDVAKELGIDPSSLAGRRQIINEARKRAGSIWDPSEANQSKTVGSFFRNPVVTENVAEIVMNYDESGKTPAEIKNMNQVHGGDERRVSAAHVMLAAGFKRGQQWGSVKLNDANLLKIEALPNATAQDVYDVAMHIQTECYNKLGIKLEPEARILGNFTKQK